MSESQDFYIKTGNTGPDLLRYLKDENGNAISLVGASDLYFKMRHKLTGEVIINAEADFKDRESGCVAYIFTADNTVIAGEYEGEFIVTLVSGEITTFPQEGYIKILISESIGG